MPAPCPTASSEKLMQEPVRHHPHGKRSSSLLQLFTQTGKVRLLQELRNVIPARRLAGSQTKTPALSRLHWRYRSQVGEWPNQRGAAASSSSSSSSSPPCCRVRIAATCTSFNHTSRTDLQSLVPTPHHDGWWVGSVSSDGSGLGYIQHGRGLGCGRG